MIFAIILLSIALIVCIALLLILKRDIRRIEMSLKTLAQTDTNMKLTTATFDKDICKLCNTVNEILEKQKKIIIENEKMNTEFRQAITNISHDLRTPLTSAIGYIQMIRSDKTPEDKKREYLTVTENRLKSLAVLMNDLFEYTKILENKTATTAEKINICNLMCDKLSEFYDEFDKNNFAVQIEIPDKPVYTVINPDSLNRITQNLLQNVIAHGTEQFSLTVNESGIIFKNKVANIKSVDIDRLFDRFYTYDFSRSSKSSGLGLAIAKELTEAAGGKITAYAEGDMLCICVNLNNEK